MRVGGWTSGAAATILVGASFPVSGALVGMPSQTSQLLRYAAGAALLTLVLGGRLGRPTRAELGRLALVAAVGMTGFNLAVLGAVDRLGATNTGVVVGVSPVVLALCVPLLAGRRPGAPLVACAAAVVLGAVIVNGTDRTVDALGLVLAVAALGCEVGFTLLAVPLIPRMGGMRVAAWCVWLATGQLSVLTVAGGAFTAPGGEEWAAIAYLAVFTTAIAFVCWFRAVDELGADRAGLLVGLMPIAALAADVVLNGARPTVADLAGTVLVAAGVAVGACLPAVHGQPPPAGAPPPQNCSSAARSCHTTPGWVGACPPSQRSASWSHSSSTRASSSPASGGTPPKAP